MTEILANSADGAQANSIGRGVFLVALLCLGLIVMMSALVLGMLSRRRARQRALTAKGGGKRSEDPWKVSGERAGVPSAEELYRASGFDQDDTRIEDSPDFGEDGPDGGEPKRRKPRKPDEF